MSRAPLQWWKTPVGRERLEYELQALAAAGIRAERDSAAFDAGVAALTVYPIVDGKEERMHVTFPDSYPYFRFVIEAPGLDLPHHQHPFAKVLCVLGRSSESWRTTDTVAKILTEQLPLVVRAGRSVDAREVAEFEEQQAEPFSDYYMYPASMLQVDGAWRLPETARSGELVIGLISILAEEGQPPHLQGIVIEVRDDEGHLLAEAAPKVKERYGSRTFTGRWSRATAPISSNDAAVVFTEAANLDGEAEALAWSDPLPVAPGISLRWQVRGVLFPEETAVRTIGEGWLFVVCLERLEQSKPLMGSRSRYMPARGKQRPPKEKWVDYPLYLARAGRSGPTDLAERIPELAPLRETTVAVFGAGCVGAPSVLEFARAGVGRLRLFDDDIVDPATTVRWPFGLEAAGRYKVEVLRAAIAGNYPYTDVDVALPYQLGRVRRPGGRSEADVLESILDGAHLLYDATADLGVQRFLSEVARERRIPYIAVSGTQGGWGGTVLRIRPGATAGCWLCYQLDTTIPAPSAKPVDGVQPAGCASPTFTSAGFDMVEIATQGVRLAVSTLCAGKPGAYPEAKWDVAVLSHRSGDGTLLVPSISVHALDRHAECPVCATRTEEVHKVEAKD